MKNVPVGSRMALSNSNRAESGILSSVTFEPDGRIVIVQITPAVERLIEFIERSRIIGGI